MLFRADRDVLGVEGRLTEDMVRVPNVTREFDKKSCSILALEKGRVDLVLD